MAHRRGETADQRQDTKSLTAQRLALALGYAHFDTAELYVASYCKELLGQAKQEERVERGSLFISSMVKLENLSKECVLKACDPSLNRLNTVYLDLYLIHWSNRSIPLEDTLEGLN